MLRGPFALQARGSASEGRQRLVASVELTQTSIEVPGQFRKAAGTPLTLDLAAAARPNLVELERAALTFAALTIKATGTLRTQGTGPKAQRSFDGTADVPPVAVRDLVAVFAPKQLADVPAVNFGARAEASGTIGQDETIKVKVPSFTLTGGRSDLQGQLSLENLKAPKVNFEARSKFLDLDDFMPPSSKAKAAAADKKDAGKAPPDKAKKAQPEPLPPQLQAMDGVVKLVVDRGRAAEIDYKALKADLTVKNGRLAARTLEVDTFGGHFSGAGTELPLADPQANFVARGEMTNLDISAVLDRFAAERNFMTGRLSGKLDLAGAGMDPEDLKKTLAGKLSGKVENAELQTISLLAPVVATLEKAAGAPLVSRYVQGAKARLAKLNDRHIDRLAGALKFDQGTMSLVKPLEGKTPDRAAEREGRHQPGRPGRSDRRAGPVARDRQPDHRGQGQVRRPGAHRLAHRWAAAQPADSPGRSRPDREGLRHRAGPRRGRAAGERKGERGDEEPGGAKSPAGRRAGQAAGHRRSPARPARGHTKS